MKELNKWLYSYDLNYSSFLNGYIDEILRLYQKPIKEGDGHDFYIDIKPITNFIIPKLNKIVEDNFYVGKKYEDDGLRVYVQEGSNEKHASTLHNHAHRAGNMCGIFYLNIPTEGGEFHVLNPPYLDEFIKIEINKVYLFPIWLMHRAMPHKDNIKRICFNWVYGGNIRPINKYTGNLW